MNGNEPANPPSEIAQDPAGEERAPEKKSLSKRTKTILAVVAIVVLVGAAAWYMRYKSYGQYMQETNDAQIRADLSVISPKIDGFVDAVLVSENEDVKKGQVLVRINPTDYRSQTGQAQAQIAQAEAAADNARSAIGVQRAQIAQAEAQLAAARTQAAHDAEEVARYRPLVEMGAETREKLNGLQSQARQSADRVRQLTAALAAQRRQVSGMQAQVREAQARGQQARAQLNAAQQDLSSTELKAPVAGRIGDKTVTAGQYVQPGTRLMSVVPLQDLYITANFKETQLALMRPGQPVEIEVDALPGVTIDGHVASISPATGAQFSLLPPENATGNFTKIVQRVPVRIALDAAPDARKLLVPGMSVTVTVDTRGADGELEQIQEQQDAMGAAN